MEIKKGIPPLEIKLSGEEAKGIVTELLAIDWYGPKYPWLHAFYLKLRDQVQE